MGARYDVALIDLPVLRPLRILHVLAFARLLSRSAARTFVGGRLVAVALMVVGIALVGSVTAAVATWFIQHAQAEPAA